ncbi:MAG TPA: hypothetical protein VFY20_09910 [Gemmatimonadales bacterium]|nr:hypothetical protein [Gemmatimonadales bacterium]
MIRTTHLLAALVLVAACGKKQEAPKAESPSAAAPATTVDLPAPAPEPSATIELGRAIGSDKRVLASLENFRTRDTIYAAVTSSNVPADAQLVATWTHESGQTVKVDTAASAAQTEFHISKKSAWPTGKYKVNVATTGGKSLGEKEFTVAK